ncbi:MAG TPA: helix-turn-helix transcriptional regulator [Anaerolineaceae bacterium]|nr:helix-turn-helix transcriptional regulator [Anaerolineaceae bacterium]
MPRREAPLSLEYVLLGLLARQPQHGYELFKLVEARIGPALVWRVKQAQLYAILEKLENQGLLASEVVEGGAHPDRRQYHLTDAGREGLTQWMRAPVESGRAMRQEFLARLYFAQLESSQTARDLITHQVHTCRGWLRSLQSGLDAAAPGSYERLVLQFRLVQVQGFLFWLDLCMQELV